jgi:hypothetical protein
MLWTQLMSGRVHSADGKVAQISARYLWSGIRLLLSHAGYKMVYWLLDEFEELEYKRPMLSSLRAFLADLRDLVDANTEGFALVLSTTVGTWDMCHKLHPAFSQRFSRVVALAPNTPDDLRRLVIEYLGRARAKSWSGDPMAPFSEQAIGCLSRVARGSTRVAVETCHVLLWHAAANGVSSITEMAFDELRNIKHEFHYARRSGGS